VGAVVRRFPEREGKEVGDDRWGRGVRRVEGKKKNNGSGKVCWVTLFGSDWAALVQFLFSFFPSFKPKWKVF
jgi:hypothetical protein